MSDTVTDALIEALGTTRKRHLCSVALCRGMWERLTPQQRDAIEVVERYVDGEADRCAVKRAYEVTSPWGTNYRQLDIAIFCATWTESDPLAGADRAIIHAGCAEVFGDVRRDDGYQEVPKSYPTPMQVPILICLTPQYHPRPKVNREILRMAEGAYRNRPRADGHLDGVALMVLSDALEDEGCDEAILKHLRSKGPHVRGCWALDAVLNKR